MDEQRFDQLSRRFASFRTRRQAVKAIAGAAVATIAGVKATAAQDCTASYSPCGGDGECCAGAVCEYGMCMPGCRIEGMFYSPWSMPAGDICLVCTPETSTTSWSPANEGMSCWSGDPNAGMTTCQSGVCAGQTAQAAPSCPPPTLCHLEGEVDPVTGMCVNPPAPAGTICGGQAMCHGGFFQPADTCDGNGFCIGGGAQAVPCAPYVCGAGGCATSCASDGDCAVGAHCDGGQCITDLGLGEPCDEDSDCQAGLCVEGVCCNQRCDGLCETCSAETGGYCQPVSCDPTGNDCTRSTCDPANGLCVVSPRPDGTPCDDGNACTTGDVCRAGVCAGGDALVCDSGSPCIIDSCDPSSGCVQEMKIEGTSCDDQTLCDGREVCDGAGNCIEGTPVVCQPPDQCHAPGVCDPDTGTCGFAELPDGTPCNDANSCTSNDICQDGVCRGTYPNLSTDFRNCGTCGNDCGAVGASSCSNGQCCDYLSGVGTVCCSFGGRPWACPYWCGSYQCNCRSVSYDCGLFNTQTCYRTVCDQCDRTCYSPCCV